MASGFAFCLRLRRAQCTVDLNRFVALKPLSVRIVEKIREFTYRSDFLTPLLILGRNERLD